MGRRLRSRLDRLFPDLSDTVQSQQSKQAQQHDSTKPLRTFKIGDRVYVKDFSTTPITWIPGKVVKVTGPLSYQVELLSGRVVCRHVDAVRSRQVYYTRPQTQSCADSTEDDYLLPDLPPTSATARVNLPTPPRQLRRSTRHCAPPERLGW